MRTKLIQVGRRLLQALPSVFGIVVISFLLTRALPGDPAVYFAGAMADEASIAEVREALGLDRTWIEQFVIYVGNLLQGDLGLSLATGRSVLEELLARLPASLELTFTGLGLAVLIAVPLGILAATRPGSWVDHLCRVLVTAGVSLPTFFTGLFLIYVFYYLLGWAPSPLGRLDIFYLPPETVTGFYLVDSLLAGDGETFRASVRQLVLPAVTLGLFALAPIARMTRAAMLNALGSDYVRTARANGLSRRTLLVTYALRNAALPVMTTLGMVFSFLLGANVLVEKVFSWPGIGSFAIEALVASDYAAVQGFVLCMALLFVVVNLVIDLLLTVIDPRVGIDGVKRFLRHFRYVMAENPVTLVAFALFLLLVVLALFGPWIVPYDPLSTETGNALRSPSWSHPFGTDHLGRDVFSRVVIATRLDLGIAVSAVALSFAIGSALGCSAGFWGGWTDRVVGRLADTIMAFPLFVLAMGVVATLGNSVANIIYATAIINLPFYARVARAETSVRRDAGYVQAARLCGSTDMRILSTQLFPNILPPMMVQVSLNMGWAILNAAGLSFIGLGVRPPDAEWGIMVAEGATYIVSGEWWLALFPGAALMLAVFCFNLMGDGLRDLVDPQRRT